MAKITIKRDIMFPRNNVIKKGDEFVPIFVDKKGALVEDKNGYPCYIDKNSYEVQDEIERY